jgi:hypothetical protein
VNGIVPLAPRIVGTGAFMDKLLKCECYASKTESEIKVQALFSANQYKSFLEKLKLSEEIFVSGQLISVDEDGLQIKFADFSFLPRTSLLKRPTGKKKTIDVDSPSKYWKNLTAKGKDLDEPIEIGTEVKRKRR